MTFGGLYMHQTDDFWWLNCLYCLGARSRNALLRSSFLWLGLTTGQTGLISSVASFTTCTSPVYLRLCVLVASTCMLLYKCKY